MHQHCGQHVTGLAWPGRSAFYRVFRRQACVSVGVFVAYIAGLVVVAVRTGRERTVGCPVMRVPAWQTVQAIRASVLWDDSKNGI
jgi:hypothetical protein